MSVCNVCELRVNGTLQSVVLLTACKGSKYEREVSKKVFIDPIAARV